MLRWLTALALAATAPAPVPVARTKAEPILVESVAFDARGRLIVSAVNAGGIFRLARDGALVRWSKQPISGVPEFYGIVADPARNALWAVTACNVQAICKAQPRLPALVRLNLRSGRIEQIINGNDASKSFGDVAVGADGTVFVSDSGAGEVLKLAPGASELARVVKLEGRASPQGLAVSDDGEVLVFSNYSDGLHRIDLRSGAHTRLAAPESVSLAGVDGVARRGNDLIVVRNGAAPARVIRVTLNGDWSAIVSTGVLAEGGALSEPTGGVARADDFVFVSRSQWSDFGADGRPASPIAPAIISRLRIPAADSSTRRTRSGG